MFTLVRCMAFTENTECGPLIRVAMILSENMKITRHQIAKLAATLVRAFDYWPEALLPLKTFLSFALEEHDATLHTVICS